MSTTRRPLGTFVGARSGDKGGAANIGACENLSTRVNDLKTRYCTQGSQFGLGQSQRSAGGLKLRA